MQTHQTTIMIRDYECDLHGVVNNAIYLQYSQFARHRLLTDMGIDWGELHHTGIDLIVIRAEIDYIAPLYADDNLTITTQAFRRTPLRIVFDQVFLKNESQEAARLHIETTGILRATRRPKIPEAIQALFPINNR